MEQRANNGQLRFAFSRDNVGAQNDSSPAPRSGGESIYRRKMGYSNSLKGCVLALPELYKSYNQKILTIITVPTAKYYSVLTDGELNMRAPEEMGEVAGITFRGSLNELRSILSVKLKQGELFANYPAETKPPEVEEQLKSGNYSAAQDSDETDSTHGEQLRPDTTADNSEALAVEGDDST